MLTWEKLNTYNTGAYFAYNYGGILRGTKLKNCRVIRFNKHYNIQYKTKSVQKSIIKLYKKNHYKIKLYNMAYETNPTRRAMIKLMHSVLPKSIAIMRTDNKNIFRIFHKSGVTLVTLGDSVTFDVEGNLITHIMGTFV